MRILAIARAVLVYDTTQYHLLVGGGCSPARELMATLPHQATLAGTRERERENYSGARTRRPSIPQTSRILQTQRLLLGDQFYSAPSKCFTLPHLSPFHCVNTFFDNHLFKSHKNVNKMSNGWKCLTANATDTGLIPGFWNVRYGINKLM